MIACSILAAALLAAPPPDSVDEAVAAFPARFEGALDDAARAQAVAEVGLLKEPRVVGVLKDHLRHPSRDVRIAVARTIGEQRDPSVAALLVSILAKEDDRKDPDAVFVAALLEGIGEADPKRHYKILEKAAGKWLEADLETCRVAARAMAQARTAEAVGDLVALMERADTRRLDQTEDAWKADFQATVDSIEKELARLTGKAIRNVKDWKDWWREHRRNWKPPSGLDETKAADPDLFTDPAGKFSVRRPSPGWAWKEDRNLTLLAELRAEGRIVAEFYLRNADTTTLASQTASAMAAEWKPKLEEDFREVAKEGTRWGVKMKFAGETAVMHEVRGNHRTLGACTLRWVFFVRDGVSYRAMGNGPMSRDDPASKELDAFFASFRFLGK